MCTSHSYPRPFLHVVILCSLGDRLTSGQPKHVAVYTRVYPASPMATSVRSSYYVHAGDTSGHASVETTQHVLEPYTTRVRGLLVIRSPGTCFKTECKQGETLLLLNRPVSKQCPYY